jgi:hypothetical protein
MTQRQTHPITSPETISFSNSLLERLEKIKKTQIRTFNQIESLKKKIQRVSKEESHNDSIE